MTKRIIIFLKSHWLLLLATALSLVLAYKDLPQTFFQQDEWWAFGLFNKRETIGGLGYFIKQAFITPAKIHYSPLSELGFYLQYQLFQVNFSGYAFVSIFIHLLNTFLVYIIFNTILRNKYLAFCSALLFAINSTSHQAVSWVATSLTTQGATFFSLLFFLTFLQYLKSKGTNKKMFIFSLFSLFIGLLFKEILAPFLSVPLLYFLYSTDKNIKSAKKIFSPFVFFLVLYLLLHLVIYVNGPPMFDQNNIEIVQAGIFEYLYRLLMLPFRVIAQSLFPASFLLLLSEIFIKLAYPQFVLTDGSVNPFIRETIVFDLVCFFISTAVIIFTLFAYKYLKKSKKDFAKGIILFTSIAIFSSVLIIFLPGSIGFASLFAPRHLYSGSFGIAGLLVLLLFALFSWLRIPKKKFFLICLILIISAVNIILIKNDISKLRNTVGVIKSALETIKSTYPRLPQKILIYTESDTAYYGMPVEEKSLPVQVGFGWMLLVWYHKTENFPACLYDSDRFLYLLAEAYKECDGRGFGYFRNYDKLVNAVSQNHLSSESVIAYSWNGKSQEFIDITNQIRAQLKKR